MSISEVIVFNGIKFRRYPESKHKTHQQYFKPHISHVAKGVQALHQEIWKAAHGPIPEGMQIHHRDGDFLNNNLENLEALSFEEHKKRHTGIESFSSPGKQLRHLETVRYLAKAWHSSPEGLAWHRKQGAQVFRSLPMKDCLCSECGKTFQSKKNATFCSSKCQARRRRKDPKNWIPKICCVCQKQFSVFVCEVSRSDKKPQRTCSRTCGGVIRRLV